MEEAKKRKRNEKDEAKRGDGDTGSGGGGTYENEDDDLLGDEETSQMLFAHVRFAPSLLKAFEASIYFADADSGESFAPGD